MEILLIDDEEMVLKTLSWFLSERGHHLRTTSDSFQALQLVEEKTPDVVISEIRLARNGLDLIDVFKNKPVNIPVIVIANYENRHTGLDALRKGAYDYIQKPVKLTKLVKILDQMEAV